MAETGK